MKTIIMFAALILSQISLAQNDQVYRATLIKKPGYQTDQTVKNRCFEINSKLQTRITNANLASELELSPYQLGGQVEYKVVRNLHGRGVNMEYTHSCELYLRITSAKHSLLVSKSATQYSGRAREEACEKEQEALENNPAVLYTSISNGLFKCNVEPIISIEKH